MAEPSSHVMSSRVVRSFERMDPRSQGRIVAAASMLIVLVSAGCGGPGAGVPVTLEQFPGNARPRELSTVSERDATVTIDTLTFSLDGGRETTHRKLRLTAPQRATLVRDLQRVNPGSFHLQATCGGGIPLGDVGGVMLTIGTARTNCAPAQAGPLVRFLSAYFPPPLSWPR